jgi:D-3-phosphoglycerate dehydrogenase / 2-oxoglutarate reductase
VAGTKLKILVSESGGFAERAAALLRQAGELTLADLDRERLLSAVGEADILWVRLRHRIDSEVMNAGQRLKIIVTPTTGLNHIDLEEVGRRSIRVLSLRGEAEFLRDIRATAEHTVALILALLRHIPAAFTHVRDGGWDRDLFKGRELHRKTVGLVGYGRLGRLVAQYLKSFDIQILAADPHVGGGAMDEGVALVSLAQLLREADLVTLHVNLCEQTRGLIGRKQFAAMKQGAWFINTSRGELVDEHALLDALNTRQLTGAALDVLCDEDSSGMQAHQLVAYARAHDNLIITPHIGGCTVESMEKTECFLADRLLTLLKHEAAI